MNPIPINDMWQWTCKAGPDHDSHSHYDYHYEHAFRGQRKNKLLFWAPALCFTKRHCVFPLSKGCRTHSECGSRCSVIQWLRPLSQLQKSDRASLIIHHRNTGLFVFFSFYTPACFACVRCMFEEQKDSTSSWAQLAYQQPTASLSIPVAMMTGSTDKYRWYPQRCQGSFTVFFWVFVFFFAWKKVLRQNFVKDETCAFFVLQNSWTFFGLG